MSPGAHDRSSQPLPSDPWTKPRMRSSLTYGGVRARRHTGAVHSGTTDFSADWGAFMTPTLVRHHRQADASAPVDPGTRARDWAEIQERMLAPLYEAVYERLEIGAGTRMLSLGCGSGLALLDRKSVV